MSSVLPVSWFSLLRFRQHEQAEAAHGSPEDGAQTSSKCQSQSGGCREAEHLHDQHVPAFIGPDISWIECARNIYQLGQSLNCERAEETELGAHEPQDQIDLEHRRGVACEIQSEAAPKCAGRAVIEVEQACPRPSESGRASVRSTALKYRTRPRTSPVPENTGQRFPQRERSQKDNAQKNARKHACVKRQRMRQRQDHQHG